SRQRAPRFDQGGYGRVGQRAVEPDLERRRQQLRREPGQKLGRMIHVLRQKLPGLFLTYESKVNDLGSFLDARFGGDDVGLAGIRLEIDRYVDARRRPAR